MEIISFSPKQFSEFLALVDDQIRPPGSSTHAWEDFPLILGRENSSMIFGICEGESVAAGIACLVRQFQTSCGPIPVAGIGSVVTRPESRGLGYSRALQNALIERLASANVPLAVLWTDQPEFYISRGFVPAGWEFHVDMIGVRPTDGFPDGFSFRTFNPEDSAGVAALYDHHPYRTIRPPGDDACLYTMPGTKGLVATGKGDKVVAAVFCGKGADFKDYVTEWDGPLGLVVPLLIECRNRGWARHLLVPAGAEGLAEQLVRLGGTVAAQPSGHWLIIQPEKLSRYMQGAGHGIPQDRNDPVALLGSVGSDGIVIPGALTVAVWGFDSV
ncbi:MAG: GNAT family N-acetyltransferase [Candidatus Krumholzibacteria bacterium]|nr:GNAT family N-acetyltransferase [Candidatus Krumholzibacteria bacterium]